MMKGVRSSEETFQFICAKLGIPAYVIKRQFKADS